MVALMLESSISHPSSGIGGGSACAAPAAMDNNSACISLAQALWFQSQGQSNGSSFAAWEGNPSACISLAQAMCPQGAGEGSCGGSTRASWDSNGHARISLADAVLPESACKGNGWTGGSIVASQEEKQNARISLALAMELPASNEGSDGSGSSLHCSQAAEQKATSVGPEEDDVCAGPMRLSLAQMLDGQASTCIPSSKSSSVGALNDDSDEDAFVRNDGTIALALALADDSPSSASQTSQPMQTSERKPDYVATQTISLHDAVNFPRSTQTTGAPPGLEPLPLLLSHHLAEDAGNVKEDFLATPLPFVGRIMHSI